YSEVGKGTVFRLLLPVSSEVAVSRVENRVPVRGHGRLLLVDDEPGIRDSGRAILTQLGYEVLLAENGADGVDVYQKEHEKIDLVLLDLAMPVMDGQTCLKKMHEIDPSIPVIVCSGFARDDVLTELEPLGVEAFLIKPFRVVELSQAIAQVLVANRPPDH
ncbi:MAG TPA: response regulator, partial [Candidatus Ozemobacteraceae bacterium]|nr:response regulator [Candidatus Ozemobacteraceae bacterium]